MNDILHKEVGFKLNDYFKEVMAWKRGNQDVYHDCL